jgi:hypothetical protein
LELRLATPSTVIGLLTRGYIRVNVLLCDGLNVIYCPGQQQTDGTKVAPAFTVFGEKLMRFIGEGRLVN